ncbi:MAG TPA: SDR family NAD(P)-dependent oxidoreductase [Solirubrobacteraceae bacterium]|jgi:NAD(P)-dependent dehydrogenase (short-subunit alcohol dehydrogenase family)|nr:SDR family NAD(P)-dependent oxidoreductase [Solirubrobacteraceae bacterium]
MSDRFKDRGVLVTGAATGMGRAITEAFLSEGARVVLVDVNGDRVDATAQELADNGAAGRVSSLHCDVTKSDQVRDTVRKAQETLGGIDVLVNNAGVITMEPVVDIPEENWDAVMDVNAKGVFLMVQAALPGMLERETGNIVNIASQAGKRGYKLFTHYCASKAAVIVFSKGVALEVAPTVRINCLCPGIVNTEMMDREYAWEEAMTGEPQESIKERWMSGIPMGRFQEPEHIARVALFIASDDASEMTGQAINITGGMVME